MPDSIPKARAAQAWQVDPPRLQPVPPSGRSIEELERSDRQFVSSLGRGMRLLQAFQVRPGPLSNKELTEITGIPKPTVSRLSHTLCELGYLRLREQDGQYELSLAVLSLGYPLLNQSRVRHVAHDFMTRLAADHDCTVMLAEREGNAMVVVDERAGYSSNTMRIDVGASIEIVRSAIGRAYLAGLPQRKCDEVLEEMRPSYEAEWPLLLAKVTEAKQQIEQRGFCLVESEWHRDTRSVAAPLINGNHVMVLGCGAPIFAVPRETFETQIGPHLVHVAGALARLIDR
jgi:DNA-binding IclR family transcriptional regulator